MANARKADEQAAGFYTGASYTVDDSIGFLVRGVHASLQRHVERRVQALDLTAMQWAPLLLLAKGKACTCAEIARLMAIDTGAMTRMVDRIEAKGLVRRVRRADDRRVVDLELTPAGRRAADELPAILSEVLNAHLAGFDEREFAQLLTLLKRMIANGAAMDTE